MTPKLNLSSSYNLCVLPEQWRLQKPHGYFTPSCVWDISMRSVGPASEWLRYSGNESERVSVRTWYRFVCIYTWMNFYTGSFNCDIAYIYGTNRRCLSSPASVRGTLAVEWNYHANWHYAPVADCQSLVVRVMCKTCGRTLAGNFSEIRYMNDCKKEVEVAVGIRPPRLKIQNGT